MADWNSWGAVPPSRPAHAPSAGWDDDAQPHSSPQPYGASSSEQHTSPHHARPPPFDDSRVQQSSLLPAQDAFSPATVNNNSQSTDSENAATAAASLSSPPPSNVNTTISSPASGMGLWKPIAPASNISSLSAITNQQPRPLSTSDSNSNNMNNSDKISPGASHANGSVTMNEPSQGQSSGDLVNQNSTVPSLSNGEWPISQSQTHPVQQVPMNSNGNGNIPLSASAHAPSTTAINNNNINTSDSKLNDGGWFTSAVTATSTNSSNTPSYGNMTASYAQEKRLPPAYVFSVPPEARAYLIGTGGANLTRIQEETPGIRITRGRPKTESDPYDRDFLVYNDNTLPQEMLDIVLGKLCRIVRRKIQDWLPLEGKAAEDARRLLDEGKLNDNGDRSPQFHQNQNGRGNEYAQGTVQASAGESDHFGARDISREASSSPVDTFPSQPGPFRDPTSPVKIAPNWGGIPPPTFSPGPRSTVSRISAGHPAPLSSTQANEARSGDALGGCKPSNPSFVPSPQSAPDSHAVPAVSSASLASNFGWNASGVPTTSAAMPQGNGNSSMPNGPSPQPISSNPSDKAAAPTSPQAGINHAVNGQDAIHSPPASGWSNRETASTNGGGPTQAVIASNPPNQATYQQAAPQTISNAAAFGWNVKQPASNAGMAPLPQAPQREQTPRPASSFHNQVATPHDSNNGQLTSNAPSTTSPHERIPTHDSGWDENPSKHAQSAPYSSAQESGWGTAPMSAALPTNDSNVASLGDNIANMRIDDRGVDVDDNGQGAPRYGQSNGHTSLSPTAANPGHLASTSAHAPNSGWKPRAFNGVPDSPTFSPAPQAPQRGQSEVIAQQISTDSHQSPANPVPSGGGIGWDDEPAPPAAAVPKDTAAAWGAPAPRAQNNISNGYTSNQSSFDDAAETVRPSDSISNVNVESRSTVNGAGYGQQSTAPSQMNGRQSDSGWGQRVSAANGAGSGNANYGQNSYGGGVNGHDAHNGGGTGNYGGDNNNGYTSNGNGYSSQGRENGFSSGGGGGGGYTSGYGNNANNGFSNNNGGYGSGGGGNNYGSNYGGPPQERRFPGPGGSWASGANDVPLQQNRWITQAGRRPGDDVRRPVVPQAIPGSGW